MPRPKSNLTKSRQGKVIGARLTYYQHLEWKQLGGGTWLREVLAESWKQRQIQQQLLISKDSQASGQQIKE